MILSKIIEKFPPLSGKSFNLGDNMIKASLILPTYKRPEETKKCLDLISKSRGLNEKFFLEVVVIDSSPNKKTWASIKSFVADFDLRYIHLKQQTLPGAARNIAIKKAKHELIISVDSDIEVKPETILQMIQYLKDNPSVAKMTGTSIFSSGQHKGQADRPTKWDRMQKKGKTLYIEGIYGRYEAFYRTPFLKLGGYDDLFKYCGEGTDISIRYWRAGYPLGFAKEVTAFHNSEAAGSLRRAIPDKMTHMYRSLFLIAYKCEVDSIEFSPNFLASHAERRDAYGEATELHSIISSARSIEWFSQNIKQIKQSKRDNPKAYDFKPFDVFSKQTLFADCVEKAETRLSKYYKEVFGAS